METAELIVLLSGILQVGWISVVGFLSKRVGELHRDVRDLAVNVARIEGEWLAMKQTNERG